MSNDVLLTRAQASTLPASRSANVEREFPNKLDHVMAARRTSRAACAASGVLRQLRLAFLRARALAARAHPQAAGGHPGSGLDSHDAGVASLRGERGSGSRLFRSRKAAPSSAAMAGVAFEARGGASRLERRRRARLVAQSRAARSRGRRALCGMARRCHIRSATGCTRTRPSRLLSRSTTRAIAIQECCAPRSKRRPRMVGDDVDAPADGALGSGFPLARADRGRPDAAHPRCGRISRLAFSASCPESRGASRQPCSIPRSSATAAILISCTSMGSICRAPGAGAIARAPPPDDPRAMIASAAADAHRAAGMAGVSSGE